jgi:hypothetical protein
MPRNVEENFLQESGSLISSFIKFVFGENRLSTSDVDKTFNAIFEKMAELNSLLRSLIPQEQKKTISKQVEIMVSKVTNTAFSLMVKTASLDKDLDQTKKELIIEISSSWIALVEKFEELNLYVSPVETMPVLYVVDKAMELGMKIGAFSATGTIDVREKAMKKLMDDLKRITREKGYVV